MTRLSARLAALLLGSCLTLMEGFLPAAFAQAPARRVALTGARVIDGTGRATVEQATIVIDNGRIETLGAQASIKIPAGTPRVDVSGKTIVPGFINSHAHLNNGDPKLPMRDQLVQQLRLYADYGVTTVFSLADDGKESVKVRDAHAQGAPDGGRLFVSGPAVTAKTAEEGRQKVESVAAMKVNIIKTRLDGDSSSRDRQPPEAYRAIIDEAHKHGLRVAAHLYYLEDAKALLDAGLDVVAHSVRDRDVDAPFIAELRRRNVGYIPTLTRDLSVFVYETTPAFFKDPFFLRHVAAYRNQMDQLNDPALQEKTRNSKDAQGIKKALEQAKRNLKLLTNGGVTIAMGTDTGTQLGRWQGYFEHKELELMVEAGLTPMQALVATTGGAARVMKLDGDLGTLQPGKWADFVVLNANPLVDIRNTRRIDSVWMAGRKLVRTETN